VDDTDLWRLAAAAGVALLYTWFACTRWFKARWLAGVDVDLASRARVMSYAVFAAMVLAWLITMEITNPLSLFLLGWAALLQVVSFVFRAREGHARPDNAPQT